MKRFIITRLFATLLPLLSSSLAEASENRDSIDLYQNHIVNEEVEIQGRNQLTIQNVTVTNTGYLKAHTPSSITITGTCIVELGGILELNGSQQYAIKYTYDSTGNRIRREKKY